MARKVLTKKTRFEVFKRDSFTCQYCGRMSPDVILEVDHINPVANGGDNELINLITSCHDCNSGKGKRKISDTDEVKKQQTLLTDLNRKREQLEMMLKWRDSLSNMENEQVTEVENRFCDKTGVDFTEHGRDEVRRLIKKYGLIEVLDCMDLSIAQYYKNKDTIEKTFSYIPKIAANRERQNKDPQLSHKYYIAGILRNRGMLYTEHRLRKMLNAICTDDISFYELKDIAVSCRNWTDFWKQVNELYEGDW